MILLGINFMKYFMLAGQLKEAHPQNQRPLLPLTSFSSISSNTNRTTSVAAKPGRGCSIGSRTGSRRGNKGSQILDARTIMAPVSDEGVARNTIL